MSFLGVIDKMPIKVVLVIGLILLLRAFMTQRSMVLAKRLAGAGVFLALFVFVLLVLVIFNPLY